MKYDTNNSHANSVARSVNTTVYQCLNLLAFFDGNYKQSIQKYSI